MSRKKKVETQYAVIREAIDKYRDLVVGGMYHARSKKVRTPYESALYGIDSVNQSFPGARVQYPTNKRGKKK